MVFIFSKTDCQYWLYCHGCV